MPFGFSIGWWSEIGSIRSYVMQLAKVNVRKWHACDDKICVRPPASFLSLSITRSLSSYLSLRVISYELATSRKWIHIVIIHLCSSNSGSGDGSKKLYLAHSTRETFGLTSKLLLVYTDITYRCVNAFKLKLLAWQIGDVTFSTQRLDVCADVCV